MIRQERRRKIREYEKELEFIRKHTPYLKLRGSMEFDLPKEQIELLRQGTHEDKALQNKFDLAVKIFTRVDVLQKLLAQLKTTNTKGHLSGQSKDKSDLQGQLSVEHEGETLQTDQP